MASHWRNTVSFCRGVKCSGIGGRSLISTYCDEAFDSIFELTSSLFTGCVGATRRLSGSGLGKRVGAGILPSYSFWSWATHPHVAAGLLMAAAVATASVLLYRYPYAFQLNSPASVSSISAVQKTHPTSALPSPRYHASSKVSSSYIPSPHLAQSSLDYSPGTSPGVDAKILIVRA
jgi:hypothetical protein